MKQYLSHVTVAASMLLSIVGPPAAQAYTFGQQEVDQTKFMTLAVPFADGKQYNLIVLEQISATPLCWRQQADHTGVIEPLLLQFDFTKICGRNTDSNGYSIRLGRQDLALDYRLSIIKRKGDLVLMGYPVRNPQAPLFKIGQTQSQVEGFLEIKLEPGWRLTKRTYNGKTLGHIYFTSDQGPKASTPNLAEAPVDAIPTLGTADTPESPPGNRPSSKDKTPDPQQPSFPSKARQGASPNSHKTRDELTQLITSPIEIPVPIPDRYNPAIDEPSLPNTHGPSGGQALPQDDADLPILAGEDLLVLPSPIPKSNQYQNQSRRSSRQKRSTVDQLASPPPLPKGGFSRPIQIPVPPPQNWVEPSSVKALRSLPTRPSNRGVLPVPPGEVPLGQFNPDPDIYVPSRDPSRTRQQAITAATGNPPPPPLNAKSRLRYRVIVESVNSAQHQKIKTLVPDAFRSSYQGRSVLQVGAYEQQFEADQRLNQLSVEGIQGILDIVSKTVDGS